MSASHMSDAIACWCVSFIEMLEIERKTEDIDYELVEPKQIEAPQDGKTNS